MSYRMQRNAPPHALFFLSILLHNGVFLKTASGYYCFIVVLFIRLLWNKASFHICLGCRIENSMKISNFSGMESPFSNSLCSTIRSLLFSSSGPKDPMSLCHGVASVVRPSVLPSIHSFQNASSSSFLNRFWFWLFHKIGLGGGFKTSTQNCEIHYLW